MGSGVRGWKLAAQGGGGVLISAGTEEMPTYGAQGHDLMVDSQVGLGWLGLMTLCIFANTNDSMIISCLLISGSTKTKCCCILSEEQSHKGRVDFFLS